MMELDHINIVKIFSIYHDDLTYYIVMEYIDGNPLSLKFFDGMNEVTLWNYTKQILEAVNYAHQH